MYDSNTNPRYLVKYFSEIPIFSLNQIDNSLWTCEHFEFSFFINFKNNWNNILIFFLFS